MTYYTSLSYTEYSMVTECKPKVLELSEPDEEVDGSALGYMKGNEIADHTSVKIQSMPASTNDATEMRP